MKKPFQAIEILPDESDLERVHLILPEATLLLDRFALVLGLRPPEAQRQLCAEALVH